MKVKLLRKKNNFTQEEFAKLIGIKRTTYAYYESEDNFPADVLETIAKEFITVPLEDLLRDNMREDASNHMNEDQAEYKGSIPDLSETSLNAVTMRILQMMVENTRTIAEANKTTAESNKITAQANKILVETNATQTQMLNRSTAGEPGEIPVAVLSKFSDLLEVAAEIGSGKKWKSKPEAVAELSKRFYGPMGVEKRKGTQHG